MSNKHLIPTYAEKPLGNMDEYTFDTIKNMFALSPDNLKIINELPNTSVLKKIITESFPINHIISRELCILYYMKLHFYVVINDDNSLKPFILVSKYNLPQIKKLYDTHGKPLPKLQYLFHQKRKTVHSKLYRNKTNKLHV
jgi:hypothetical protein